MSARSQNRRTWMLGGAVIAALIVGCGWFFVISPQLSSASSTRNDAETARMQNVVLQAKNLKLKQQNEKAGTLRASLAIALAELPSDGGLPAFTRQLSAQATADEVVLSSITVGAAAALVGSAPAAASTTGTSAAPVETSAAAPSSAAPAPGAAGAGATSVVAIPITLSASGLGGDAMAFLRDIQVTGPRRALVTASQLSPIGGKGAAGIAGPCTLNLTLTIFSAPLTPTAKAALEKLISGK